MMRGTMLILEPGQIEPRGVAFDRQLKLEELKAAIGGGYLEIVPGFTDIGWFANLVHERCARCAGPLKHGRHRTSSAHT